ncbi:hypothetical protein Tco_1171945 [Tanacetum coccineum]
MDNLGYVTEGKLTFYKNKFSPQWRFLVHTILHCLSTKSGSWDQFGSSLVVALICLSDGRKFNWSSYIFKGMVSNIGNAKKFLMYPRFIQTILGIKTSITRQYHVFKLSSKLFANMKLNFEGQPMPLLAAMLSQAQAGEVFKHGQSSDPNIASFSRAYETDDEPFTSTNVEDEPLGGSFHASPPRSTQAPPAGHTSGGAEDLITLTALSSVVSTFVQKVNSLETELKAHKKLFKDVVAKRRRRASCEIEAARLEALERERFEKEKGEIARQDAIYAKQLEQEEEMSASQKETRQVEVLSSAKQYSDADWIDIMAQVHANACLSYELLGADVNDDNFAERIVALINQKKREFAK